MNLIHTNLAMLSSIAEQRENTRYAVTGVHLSFRDGNRYRAEATDTKMLLRVEGPCVGNADDYPDLPGMSSAPNGQTAGLILSSAWKSKLTASAKLTKKLNDARDGSPNLLRSVAVKIGSDVVTMGATNLESSPVETVRLVEGRFPPTDNFMPTSAAKFSVTFDSHYMVKLLEAIQSMAGDQGTGGAKVVLTGHGSQNNGDVDRLLLKAVNDATGQVLTGLLVPMVGDGPVVAVKSDDSRISILRDENKALRALRKDLEAENAGLRSPATESDTLTLRVAELETEKLQFLQRIEDSEFRAMERRKEVAANEQQRYREFSEVETDCIKMEAHRDELLGMLNKIKGVLACDC